MRFREEGRPEEERPEEERPEEERKDAKARRDAKRPPVTGRRVALANGRPVDVESHNVMRRPCSQC